METKKERAKVVVTSPYNGREIDVEPFLKFLAESPNHIAEILSVNHRTLQLELMLKSDGTFHDEMSELSRFITMMQETMHDVKLIK